MFYADIDSPCTEFEKGTPLHIAASNLSLETTKVLLQNGANTGIKDDLGRTPLGILLNMLLLWLNIHQDYCPFQQSCTCITEMKSRLSKNYPIQ